MKSSTTTFIIALTASTGLVLGQSFPEDKSFTWNALPHTWRNGQIGYNDCAAQNGSTDPQGQNMCQTAVINSVQDFCLWGPPVPNSEVGATEAEQVAFCTTDAYNTRVFPAGTITGAHFVQTSEYIQITGVGDFTKINIKKGDAGGELDPYGATLQGNPVGGLVYTTAFGGGPLPQQVHVWTNYMSDTQFCFRACYGDQAPTYCNHIYDEQGCTWNMPGDYRGDGVYEQCLGEPDEPMGIYNNSTWYQAQPGYKTTTPSALPVAPSSSCKTYSTIGSGVLVSSTTLSLSTSTLSSSGSIISLSTSMPSATAMSISTIVSSSSSLATVATLSPVPSAQQLVVTSTTPAPMETTSSVSDTTSSAGGLLDTLALGKFTGLTAFILATAFVL